MDKPNFLIIEDNPVSRKLLRTTLETENYTVVEAEGGLVALQEAKKQKFDLIIQDIFLPDMNGYLLNEQLRAIPGVENVPIFALSGFLNELDKQAQHSGFTLFLLKPIEPSYLLDVVKAHLPISLPSKILVGKGKHILIADDNPIQLKLLSMQLKNLGFEVTTALDGELALKEAMNRKPDAIISDILMPNMDGFSLCLEIKRHPTLRTIPVLLLTSHYLEDEDLVLAKKVGASCYLTRTPDEEKLFSELLAILNDKPFGSAVNVPIELTEEIKEKHTIRSIRQLEQQVQDNTRLAQRCALLKSQLTLIDGIANALTTSSKDIEQSLKEVLYFCLDAIGVSKGALYVDKPGCSMVLSQHIGYKENERIKVAAFFGLAHLVPKIIEKSKPFAIPSEFVSEQDSQSFLFEANVKSALFVPLFSGMECLGILFLGSDSPNLSNISTVEFVRTLGMQFGQSIALATAFDKVGSSEKRYRQLVEISPDAIFIQQQGRFVYANGSALQLLNARTIDELLARSFYDFFPTDYQQVIKKYIQEEKSQVATTLPEGTIINFAGDSLDVEIVVSPFLYKDGAAIYMIMRDITERKRSALHLEIQYAIAWILADSDTLYLATAKILKIICERMKWDCGTIWAVDKEANVMRCTRMWQQPHIQNDVFQQETLNLVLAPGDGMLASAWKDKKAIWRSDIRHGKSFLRKKSIKELGFNTAVAFPVLYENDVLGVIEFFSKDIIKPSDDTLLWFESIGNQFGIFLMRKHMEKQMLYLAEHDVLTGLSNRSLLEQYLNTAISSAKENKTKLAILFLDLDHFKYVNDSMGHQAGDLLLKEISERFRQCLRPEDTISRLGGDEFIIILPNVERKEEIINIIGRLQNQLSTQIILKDKEFYITASIGISLYPEDGLDVQTLIKVADIAMYSAKEKGRNNYQFCTLEMTAFAENRGLLQANLRDALEKNEFVLYYQPQIDVTTQKIIGVEALIRWQRPEVLMLPGNFIPAAEDSDLIIPIGEWVFRAACLQYKIWEKAGLPNIKVCINLSIRNLNKHLIEVIESTIRETNINPNYMEIELTESVLMENVEYNIQILRRLKEMGFKISIDDFGTGYSSLSYLKRFPIDTIKIDQSFVRDIAIDPDDAAIVTAIIAMAHSLNFKVMAEGVETMEQLKFLCDHGCDEIQGYYFSCPLSVVDATEFIKNSNLSTRFSESKLV